MEKGEAWPHKWKAEEDGLRREGEEERVERLRTRQNNFYYYLRNSSLKNCEQIEKKKSFQVALARFM